VRNNKCKVKHNISAKENKIRQIATYILFTSEWSSNSSFLKRLLEISKLPCTPLSTNHINRLPVDKKSLLKHMNFRSKEELNKQLLRG